MIAERKTIRTPKKRNVEAVISLNKIRAIEQVKAEVHQNVQRPSQAEVMPKEKARASESSVSENQALQATQPDVRDVSCSQASSEQF